MRLNKRGVEALPLRYIIIALVAALVIGIALQFTGILRSGTISTATQINKTLTEKTTCELDEEKPIVSNWEITCNASNDIVNVTSVKIEDDCGVEWAKIELMNSTNDFNGLASLVVKSKDDDTWWTNGALNFTDPTQVDKTYDIQSGDIVVIWVKDKATAENYAVAETVTCQ